jgi:tRNA modification GTPase
MLISNGQVEMVQNAYEAIINSFSLIEMQELELFSYNIQEAIMNIAQITKPYEHDEMLDKMFGNFCVGK